MTGCRAYGAEEIRDAFEREIEKTNLQEKVEIVETGCHGFCAKAPVLAIDPLGVFYQQLTPDDVPEIVSMRMDAAAKTVSFPVETRPYRMTVDPRTVLLAESQFSEQ